MTARNGAVAIMLKLLVLGACSGPKHDEPAVAGTAEPTPMAAAGATPEVAATPAGFEPGVLLLDWGPRGSGQVTGPGALVPLDASTGAEIKGVTPVDFGQAPDPLPSPDGRYLAAIVRGWLSIIGLSTWEEREIASASGMALVWSRDGRMLYGVRPLGGAQPAGVEVWAFDVANGTRRVVAKANFEGSGLPLVSPDGRMLYLFAYRATECCGIDVQGPPFIAALEIATGRVTEVPLPGVLVGQRPELLQGDVKTNTIWQPAVAMTPDGGKLFVAHADGDDVTVVDLARLAVERTVEPRPPASVRSRIGSWLLGLVVSPAEAKGGLNYTKQAVVSPDGTRLYVTGAAGEMCEGQPYFACIEHVPVGLQVIDTKTLELLAEFDGVSEVALSPDGQWLLGTGWSYDYRDESAEWATEIGYGLTVIDAKTLKVATRYAPTTAFTQLAVSPDSRFAYLVSTGSGYHDSMANRGRCVEACYLLTVIDLPQGEVSATRDLFGVVRLFDLVP